VLCPLSWEKINLLKTNYLLSNTWTCGEHHHYNKENLTTVLNLFECMYYVRKQANEGRLLLLG
jgi:hypothetical protein